MTEPALIDDPDAVTPEWMTDVLRASGAIRDARVVGLDPRQVGTGQMGASVRFGLTYDLAEPDAPDSVVGKFPSTNPISRATGVGQGAYLKEVRFYQALQKTVQIRTPHCHFARIEQTSGSFVLVLEDLSPAVQGDQIAGCSVDQAALALLELAKLHAPHWGSPSLLELDWMSPPSPESAALLKVIYQSVFPGFVERYEGAIGPEHLALAEELGENLVAWTTAMADGPLCVIHGDYRLDNMLFGTAEGGHPLAVVDWQTCGVGPAVSDAAYFLGASLLPVDRRAHEEALLRDYHAALIADGRADYGWDQCWADYARYSFSGVLMAVVASMIVERHDRGDEMFIAMATRHATHALDLDATRFLKA
ncbi:MAG: phosphotransferase [Deltaproteobacteria bacterium]|nr:phosphotransferase [Deltaproteobacteria bacterium]MBW2384199.1 phosphotransferase [Deltaproteobacteria bacterium]MBW2695363.1 phosphotransferase [Deltaproteobacteria bacterium]